jgi:1-acyl-sn-glycerol-3-phosphate acyltransferase
MNMKNLAYWVPRRILSGVRNYILDWVSVQVGNIPEGSYVAVPHHNTGFDGVLVSTLINEKTHFWIQFERVFNSNWKKVLDLLEEIPIKINGGVDRESLEDAIKQSRHYLKQGRQVVGVFNDGPSANLRFNGRILELEERPNYTGAAYLAKLADVPVVPISLWCPQDFREKFWAWKQGASLGDRTGGSKFRELCLERLFGEKQPYRVWFGEPLEPCTDKKTFAKKIREEQLRGYNQIRRE